MSYSFTNQLFNKESSLSKDILPNYFKFLRKNELIVSDDAKLEPMNAELLEGYIIPNQITSMIDVPLRSEGKMIGAICFEHVQMEHQWTYEEKKFTQSIAQLLSLALETNKKKAYRLKLEKIIIQKEVLISEINHRVKNNMAVILSLLNLQKRKTEDNYHSGLFDEVKDKVYSMSIIQEQLHSSGNIDNINLGGYLENLVANLNNSYGQEKNIEIHLELEKIGIDVSKAIPCGLIANEILTNSFNYAFGNQNLAPKLSILLGKSDSLVELTFKDNGGGFDLDAARDGMGLELINDLAEQIDALITYHVEDGVQIKLLFPLSS